jgi:hypothetical protein
MITIDRADIIRLIKSSTGKSTEYATGFITFASESSGLLREIGLNKYAFVHRIVMDYFVDVRVRNQKHS